MLVISLNFIAMLSIYRDWLLHYRSYLVLSGVWLLVVLLVGPTGDFAVNDDWAYAHNLQALTRDGVFYFSDYPAMTLVGQTLLAAPVVLVFGLSFTVLRMLTLVLMLFASWWLLRLLKNLGSTDHYSLMITLMVMGSGMFMSLAFSFMTEWYYLFLMIGSVWYFFRYWDTKRWKYLMLAVVFAALTMLVRQTGLLLLLSFACTQFIFHPKNVRNILLAGFPVVLGMGVLIAYKYFRLSTASDMGSYSRLSTIYRALISNSPDYYLNRLGLIVLYTGLFTLPALPIYLKTIVSQARNKVLFFFVSAILIVAIYSIWQLFPTGNLVYNFGIGPHLLKDAVFKVNLAYSLPHPSIQILKVIFAINGLAATCFLVLKVKQIFRRQENDFSAKMNFQRFLLVLIGAELLYLLMNPVFFDRYLLPSLLILFILIGMQQPVRKAFALYPILILVFGLNVLFVRDYMNWHRARYDATSFLENDLKVEPRSIDGGYEFNGWLKTAPISKNISDPNKKSWWFIDDDTYLITSGPFPGYKEVNRFSAKQLINKNYNEVWVLKRE